jgi:hypothetical protein
MSPVAIGLAGIAVLIALFLIGTPVGFAMAMVGTAGFACWSPRKLALVCWHAMFFPLFLITH